ncbi:hypothetical protein ACFOWB_22005 [Chenggangzhangella methanolivorans]|uniref:hypothetical protein n=1 Tax=Chenggangzhangella methanolivorans TaxID=1437009 RepID=UPI0036172AF1
MDSRAGGVTESIDAGADLERARRLPGRSNLKTTARHSRDGASKTSKVAKLRAAPRADNTVETKASNAQASGVG